MITEKFKNLFGFGPKSNIKAGDGLNKGRFPFYTSSPKLTKWIDKEQHFKEALIFGTGGFASVHFEDKPFSTSTDCIVAITINKEIKTKFVYYYLFGNIHLLERGFKGAGLKHISKKYIENLDIPVLPIETQNKIVAILDKASTLITKREESITMLDELLRATFLDMFGDPVRNPKKWESCSLIELCDKINDGTHKTPVYLSEGVKFISAKNIINNEISWEDIKYISQEESEFINKRCNPELNDILLTKSGSLGQPAIINVDFKFTLFESLALIKYKRDELLPSFLISFLRSKAVDYFYRERTKGVAVKHLHLIDIKSIPVIKPPMIEQQKFESIYASLKKNELKIKDSRHELLNQFNSILQNVFNWKLNFNIDFELDAFVKEIDKQNKENEEYSANDNDRTELKSNENIKSKKKPKPINKKATVKKVLRERNLILEKAKNIPFNEAEGNAILKKVFSKKARGFGFDEFETFIKKAGFTYEYRQLKDFIFSKLENKELTQFYSSQEWREKNYKKKISPFQDDFAGDGKIYLVPNDIKK